jgi:hypothetical protein
MNAMLKYHRALQHIKKSATKNIFFAMGELTA